MISRLFATPINTARLMLILAVLLAALPGNAQQPPNIAMIGWFYLGSEEGALDGFRQGLRELGYVEGQNIAIVSRRPEGSADHFVEQIEELARLNVRIIVTGGVQATVAAKRAALPIPVVFVMSDPVGAGVVASLAHP